MMAVRCPGEQAAGKEAERGASCSNHGGMGEAQEAGEGGISSGGLVGRGRACFRSFVFYIKIRSNSPTICPNFCPNLRRSEAIRRNQRYKWRD